MNTARQIFMNQGPTAGASSGCGYPHDGEEEKWEKEELEEAKKEEREWEEQEAEEEAADG